MPKVLIVVEPRNQEVSNLTITKMVSAIKSAISTERQLHGSGKDGIYSIEVEVLTTTQLTSNSQWLTSSHRSADVIFCPLTLNFPNNNLLFPSHDIIKICRDVLGLRQHLAQQIQVAIGDGCLWLPVVLTAKGPLYGEVIALADAVEEKLPEDLSLGNLTYYQPFHLSDALRQPLYQMAYQLLQSLLAPPATYLVQFGLHNSEICFDRLWPFPAAPALASLGITEPDLFTCHWHTLAAKPVHDLTIVPLK